MKNAVLLIALLFVAYPLFSQTPIGHYYDVNGTPMHGYFDPLEYTPKKQISIIHFSDGYTKGCYYDFKGEKIEGLIKFAYNKIYFKEHPADSELKLKVTNVTSFLVGQDSFFVDFGRKSSVFFQFMSKSNNHTFAIKYEKEKFIDSALSNETSIYELVVKNDTTSLWISIDDKKYTYSSKVNKEFKKLCYTIFHEYPIITNWIEREGYSKRNLNTIIKLSKVLEKYKTGELTYYNNLWNRIYQKETEYYSKIVSFEDERFSVEYYKTNDLLYTIEYTTIPEFEIFGKYKAFNQNNLSRKELVRNMSNDYIKSYFPNGNIHYEYEIEIIKTDFEDKEITTFDKVYNLEGQNIIENGSASETFYDEITQKSIINVFLENGLKESYRIEDGEKIYRFHSTEFNFKMRGFETILKSFLIQNKKGFLDSSIT